MSLSLALTQTVAVGDCHSDTRVRQALRIDNFHCNVDTEDVYTTVATRALAELSDGNLNPWSK